MDPSKLFAVLAAAMLVMTAFASVPVAAEDHDPGLSVETDEAADVTDTSATLNGNLTALGNASNATTWFEYWVQGDSENNSTTNETGFDETGVFSEPVDDLEPNTTYVYVAHAETENESVTGEPVNFTTAGPLDVETLDAGEVTNNSATLNGELTGLGNADSVTVWFEYWIEGDRDNTSEVSEDGATLNEPGTFNETVEDLESNTNYVFVAHASTGVGWPPGDADVTSGEGTFTTEKDGFDEGDDHFDEADEHRWDGQGPFGQWVSRIVKGLLGGNYDESLGQIISELVKENNPGSDKRSDKAKGGGNGNGPPEHAGPSGEKHNTTSTED